MPEFFSFDIFDTVLIRDVCNPKALFLFLGKEAARRGILEMEAGLFQRARVESESAARHGLPDGEADLDQIYFHLANRLGLMEEKRDQLIQLELEWEERLIRPVPGIEAFLASCRKGGRPIHFLSDMYLPASFLEKQLSRFHLMRPGDVLWVSNHHRASKYSGRLFSLMLGKEGIAPQNLEHHGNDWQADVSAPSRLGIRTVHRPEANPNRYEKLLESHSSRTDGWTSALAGTGRRLRLEPNVSGRTTSLRAITGNVIGPSLACFAYWVLKQASRQGIRRLYFVSRDGYFPLLAARRIAADWFPDMECHYLFGSRQAWHLAGWTGLDEMSQEWMAGHSDGATCNSLLHRLGLDWEECRLVAPELIQKWGEGQKEAGDSERQVLLETLRNNRAIQSLILVKAGERKKGLLRYAEQEGLLDDGFKGLVELGWSGRTRASLELALGEKFSSSARWFYLGLHPSAKIHDPQRVQCFLYGPGSGRPEIPYLPVVAESFCMAPHGSVTDYKEQNGRILPVFRDGIEKELDQWGRQSVIQAMEQFVGGLPVWCPPPSDPGTLADATWELLNEFCMAPSAAEAAAWGTIPFEHDQASGGSTPLSPDPILSLTTFRNGLLFGDPGRACMGKSVGVWGAGSWARRTRPLLMLRGASALGYLRVNWKLLPNKVRQKTQKVLARLKLEQNHGP